MDTQYNYTTRHTRHAVSVFNESTESCSWVSSDVQSCTPPVVRVPPPARQLLVPGGTTVCVWKGGKCEYWITMKIASRMRITYNTPAHAVHVLYKSWNSILLQCKLKLCVEDLFLVVSHNTHMLEVAEGHKLDNVSGSHTRANRQSARNKQSTRRQQLTCNSCTLYMYLVQTPYTERENENVHPQLRYYHI